MDVSIALVTIKGIAPYTQSHRHDEPKLEGEGSDAYDARTWRSKMNTEMQKGRPTVIIPSFGFHQALADAARYSKRQIPGQGKATWTAKFSSGIMLMENPSLNIDPATVQPIVISAHADGRRGSGSRVLRRFPQIPAGWTSVFQVHILDPIITQDVFREFVTLAGLFIGVGQFRPQNGGNNGRFALEALDWQDNRKMVA